jgi:hypothetical protein
VTLEAAVGITFIGFIGTLGLAVAHIGSCDAVTVSTGPFTLWIATALFAVVEAVSSEATHLVSFIRVIRALGFTVTVVVIVDTLTVFTGELGFWVAAASLDVVEVETFEAAFSISIIRSIGTLLFSITKSGFGNAVARGTGELRGFEATTEFVVIEWEALVATSLVTFIRFISTLGFSITDAVHFDAVSVGTSELRFWVAAASLVIIESMSLEAAFLTFIRSIETLSFSITFIVSVDTLTTGTFPLEILAATFKVIVEWKFSEAAFLVTFIRSISTLGFTITVLGLLDALSVGTGQFGGWVAATFFDVVETEFLEAALLVSFIGSISTLGFSVTHLTGIDALAVGTLPFRFLATAFLVIVESEVLETALSSKFLWSSWSLDKLGTCNTKGTHIIILGTSGEESLHVVRTFWEASFPSTVDIMLVASSNTTFTFDFDGRNFVVLGTSSKVVFECKVFFSSESHFPSLKVTMFIDSGLAWGKGSRSGLRG